MKALPFLELDLSYDTFRHRYINGNELIPEKEILNEYIIWFDTLKEFYSRPFKPEMITEYFEGWRKSPNPLTDNFPTGLFEKSLGLNNENEEIFDVVTVHFGNKESEFEYTFEKGRWHILGKGGWIKATTLNDFISDCNRAGIELNWKPEIIKQYFQ